MTPDHWDDDVYQGRLDLALWRRIAAHARPYARPLAGLGLSGLIIAVIEVMFPLVTGLVIDEASREGRGKSRPQQLPAASKRDHRAESTAALAARFAWRLRHVRSSFR